MVDPILRLLPEAFGDIVAKLLLLDAEYLSQPGSRRDDAVRAFCAGIGHWTRGEKREWVPAQRTPEQLRQVAEIVRMVITTLKQPDADWSIIDNAHKMVAGVKYRRAEVVRVLESLYIHLYHLPGFKEKQDDGIQNLIRELRNFDEQFGTLDRNTVRSSIESARPEREKVRKGGATNIGACRVAAELSLACGAFGDKLKDGEEYVDALDRVQNAYQNARAWLARHRRQSL